MIRLLAEDIGPRRPCSDTEKRGGATALVGGSRGVGWRRAPRRSAATRPSAQPYALLFGASLAGGLLQRARPRRGGRHCGRRSAARSLGALEGDLRRTPCPTLLARRPSVNVSRHVPAAGPARRRVCLCGHLDTEPLGPDVPSRVSCAHLAQLLQVPAVAALALAAAAAGAARSPAAARCAPPRSAAMALLARDARRARAARRGRPRRERQRVGSRASRCSSPPSAPPRRSSTPRSTC